MCPLCLSGMEQAQMHCQAFSQLDLQILLLLMMGFLAKDYISNLVLLCLFFFGLTYLAHNTVEAEYAYRVYSKGTLLINWTAVFSAFPVIHQDQSHFVTRGTFSSSLLSCFDLHVNRKFPKL
jgi:hypothetical protein